MPKEKIHLNYRRILKISGPNQVDFLNNILTSDISKLNEKEILIAKKILIIIWEENLEN